MPTQLSDDDQAFLKNLEENQKQLILQYKKEKELQLQQGGQQALEKELEDLNSYIEQFWQQQVDDVLPNIQFLTAKTKVLEKILNIVEE